MSDFQFYFGLGWDHIMSMDALDHILFVLVLAAIYLLQDWKKVLILITAFTIGHSITLALSTLNLVQVQSHWVEFLIPCTIVITAISNLFHNTLTRRAAWIAYGLALCFGLIHGLGFANTLRFMLAQDQHLGWALFGFNVGLEVGQVIIVMMILTLAQVVVQGFKIARRDWILFISAAVFSLALSMALERFPTGKKDRAQLKFVQQPILT